jgi:predicted membrane-bound dolichyl-phosphate-mannose-protein mannosyltransferase
MLPTGKRILRGVVEVVATAAAAVFVLDNRLSGTTGVVLFVVSIAVLLVLLFVWLAFDLTEDTGFWPDKPK